MDASLDRWLVVIGAGLLLLILLVFSRRSAARAT
jgi:LPXTG-motif cell wall-anchored protein